MAETASNIMLHQIQAKKGPSLASKASCASKLAPAEAESRKYQQLDSEEMEKLKPLGYIY